MSWLGKIGATIFIFLGSIFGISHQTQNTQPVNSPVAMPISQTSGNQGATVSAPAADQTVNIETVMQQIGCTDAASCEGVCMKAGMTSACVQLQSLMSSRMSGGRTAAAYTTGSPSGPSNNLTGDVAFVGNNTTASAGSLPACPSNNALFDASPISTGSFSSIEPMGHMNGEHILPNQADHLYLYASGASAPIYAPGNVTILAIATTKGIAGSDKGANSVKVFFSPCKSLMFAYQMNTLSPELQSAIANLQPVNTQAGATVQNAIYVLSLPVKSGDELGTVISTNGQPGGTDFAAVDMRTAPLTFIDQAESTGFLANSYQYAVCPLDYFDSTLRSSLYSLLSIKNAGANGVPACGSVMQDKAGTAQGNWYNKSDATPSYQGINESSLFAIAHYNFNPAEGIVSVGTDLIPSSYLGSQLIFQPKNSGYINREPSQITADGNVYCFEGPVGSGGNGPEGHIDIRLKSATTLEADYAPGTCASTPTLSQAVTSYSR